MSDVTRESHRRALVSLAFAPADLYRWVPHLSENMSDPDLWRAVHYWVVTGNVDDAVRVLSQPDLWLDLSMANLSTDNKRVMFRALHLMECLRESPAHKEVEALLASAYFLTGDCLAAYVTGQQTTVYGQVIADAACMFLTGN